KVMLPEYRHLVVILRVLKVAELIDAAQDSSCDDLQPEGVAPEARLPARFADKPLDAVQGRVRHFAFDGEQPPVPKAYRHVALRSGQIRFADERAPRQFIQRTNRGQTRMEFEAGLSQRHDNRILLPAARFHTSLRSKLLD